MFDKTTRAITVIRSSFNLRSDSTSAVIVLSIMGLYNRVTVIVLVIEESQGLPVIVIIVAVTVLNTSLLIKDNALKQSSIGSR